MAKNVSVPALVRAGFAALDEFGVEGITMRDIARRLGVQAPAIYWHMRSRQDLIDAMATEMWRLVHARLAAEPAPAGRSWADVLTTFARTVRDEALARRDGARLLAGTYLTDDSVLRAQEATFEGVQCDGIAPRRVARAYVLVYSFVIGYVIEEQARRQAPDDRYDPALRAARLGGEVDPELNRYVLDTSNDRFDDLLASIVHTASRELEADPASN